MKQLIKQLSKLSLALFILISCLPFMLFAQQQSTFIIKPFKHFPPKSKTHIHPSVHQRHKLKVKHPFSHHRKQQKQAQNYLNQVLAQAKNIHTVKLKAKIDVMKRFIRLRGDLEVYLLSRNEILIHVHALGLPISSLLIRHNKIYFKDYLKNTLKIRRNTERNLARHIPIKLPLKQFIMMLKGFPPTISYQQINFDANRNLILKNRTETQRLIFHKHRLKKMELTQNRKKRMDISFGKIKHKQGIPYFSKITFKDYKKNIKSKMTITSISFNQPINSKLFAPLQKN